MSAAPLSPEPSFTVIVPLYNKRSFIRRTIESVLAQRHPSFEVVLVDDASTDGSVGEIADLVRAPLRLVQQPNAGPGAARNRGAVVARGRWLAFIDADDLWSAGHLDELARIIAAHPAATVVATTSRQLPASSAMAAPPQGPAGQHRTIDYFIDRGETAVHTSSVAVLREAFVRTGGFGPCCPGEDEEFWARLALDETFAVSDAATSVYLRANGGIMDRVAEQQRVPVTVASSPVGATLRAALADPARRDRHAAIHAYLRRLHLRDARICLYAGSPAMARTSLRAAGWPGSLQTLLYWPLAIMPGRLGQALAHAYPALRRAMRR